MIFFGPRFFVLGAGRARPPPPLVLVVAGWFEDLDVLEGGGSLKDDLTLGPGAGVGRGETSEFSFVVEDEGEGACSRSVASLSLSLP